MGLTYFYYLSNQANLDSINAIPLLAEYPAVDDRIYKSTLP